MLDIFRPDRGQRAATLGFLLVLVIAILFLPVQGTTTSPATGNDMTDALRITRGEMMERVWRPVVYASIAMAFLFFGPSVKSSMWVTRLFYSLSLCLTYMVGARLYGPAVGLMAALLVVSSFGINHSASFAIPHDTMPPFLILLFVLALHASFEARRKRDAMVAGIVLGLGCLTKEVLFPYLFLPPFALLLVRAYRGADSRALLGWLYGGFAAAYVPWVVFASAVTGKAEWFLGDAAPWALAKFMKQLPEEAGTSGMYALLLQALVWELPQSAAKYYREYLQSYFNLAPLLVASAAFVVVRAVYARRGADVLLAASILFYVPSVLVQSVMGERVGHGMPLFYLSYLAVAVTIAQASRWVAAAPLGRIARPLGVSLGVLLALALIGAQWLAGPNSSYRFLFERTNDSGFGKLSFYRTGFIVEGRFSTAVEEAAGWITGNVPAGSSLIVDGATRSSFQFMTSFSYLIDGLPTITSTDEARGRLRERTLTPGDRVLLCLPSAKFFMGDVRRYRVFFFAFEKDILDAIRASKATHVLLGPERLFVSLYLDAAPWARLAFRNAETSIYEIRRETVAPLPTWQLITANQTVPTLGGFKAKYAGEFEEFQKLLGQFNLTERDLLNNTYDAFQRRWVREHMGETAKIMYSNPLGVFLIPEWEQKVSWFNHDRPLSSLKGFDYLMLHSLRRVNPEYPRLFADLDRLKPVRVFPRLPAFDFGEGWEIYRLPASPTSH